MAPRRPNGNKQETAYQLIRRRITDGSYAPAQRLVIDTLARDFNMSQVPIREAIRKLEAEGWVVYPKNSGPVVAFVSREQWASSMEVLAVLEGYATALAAQHMTDRDIELLRRINDKMSSALKDFDFIKFSSANREFHTAIYARCPNSLLVEDATLTRSKLDAIRGTLFPTVPQRGIASISEHEELIETFENHAPLDNIERLARQHKLNFVAAATRAMDSREHSDERLVAALP